MELGHPPLVLLVLSRSESEFGEVSVPMLLLCHFSLAWTGFKRSLTLEDLWNLSHKNSSAHLVSI